MRRETLILQLEHMVDQLKNGCGNHGCIIKRPSGQATNGACKCASRNIATKLQRLAASLINDCNFGGINREDE